MAVALLILSEDYDFPLRWAGLVRFDNLHKYLIIITVPFITTTATSFLIDSFQKTFLRFLSHCFPKVIIIFVAGYMVGGY
jgi:hypothetical protein